MSSIIPTVSPYLKLPWEARDYQEQVIEDYGLFNRAGLYLDMGLGKTFVSTMIACYKLLKGAYTTIVIAPPVLLTQWYLWLKSIGLNKVAVYAGTPEQRSKINMDVDFLIMSPAIFRQTGKPRRLQNGNIYHPRDDHKFLTEFFKKKKLHFIIDEATMIKSTKSQIYRRFRVFMGHEASCNLLTGTPLVSPQDAYAYMKLITPEVYATKRQFERIHIDEKNEYSQAVSYKNLRLLRDNFFLQAIRLEANEVLDLPPVDYQIIRYDLDPQHLKLYKRLVKERLLEIEATGEIIDATKAQSLRHWCQRIIFQGHHLGLKKKPVGVELVQELVDEVEQCVCFATYVETNDLFLDEVDDSVGYYGKVTDANKEKNKRAFIQKDARRIFINPASGGFGVDGLQDVCNHTVFAEFPITPNWFRQAVARVWRQGQEKPVIVKILVARNTIQESLMRRAIEKDDVLAEVQPTSKTLRQEFMV